MPKYQSIPHQMVYRAWTRMKDKWPKDLDEPDFLCNQETVRLNYSKIGDAPPYISQLSSRTLPEFIPTNKMVDPRLWILAKSFDAIRLTFDNVFDHRHTYVIPESDDKNATSIESLLNPQSFTDLNTSQQRLTNIASIWITKAAHLVHHNMLDLSDNALALEKSRYLMLGKPGVGKTAFINYLFSTHSDLINNNNILLVRIDLSDSNDRNLSLRAKLNTKFFRIFCTHYLHAQSRFGVDFLTALRVYLIDAAVKYDPRIPLEEITAIVDTYITLMHQIRDDTTIRLSHDSAWTPFTIPHDIGHMLTRHLITYLQRTYKIGYIFIFDGLDSVSIDSVHHQDYKLWLSDLVNATDNERNPYRALYLITMRDYSYIGAYKLFNDESMPEEKRFIKCRVLPVNAEQIISRRCSFATIKASDSYPNFKDTEAANVLHNIAIILVELLSPTRLSSADLSQLSFAQCIEMLLSKLNYDNIRMLFRLLREFITVIANILSEKQYSIMTSNPQSPTTLTALEAVRGSYWRLYRVLMYGSAAQAAYTNKFSYDNKGEMHNLNSTRALIPNIFNYRDVDLDDSICPASHCLIKMRIAQYLNQCHSKTDYINTVMASIAHHFDYPISKLKYETREMIYGGLLEPQITGISVAKSDAENTNYKIALTAVEELITGRLLDEPIYYETVCDDTPIAKAVATRMECINRYDSAITLGEYIVRKTQTIMSFMLYLASIDKLQMEFLELDRTTETLPYKPIFTDKRMHSILEEIVNYVSGYYRRSLVPNINTFIGDWERTFDVTINRGVSLESEHRA